MPKVFRQEGFEFFFYSNEHAPAHVHVLKGGGEAVFFIEPEIELREAHGIRRRDLKRAEELARIHRGDILRKWNVHINRQS
jgi:hypothetical protein